MQSAALQQTFARLAGRPYDPATDRELIARFHQERDESAFAALVDKHGPMVLGICRRKLKDAHAADDAFQATFLILARKAGKVRWQESLGGWLYQVAVHVCRKVITRSYKRGVVDFSATAEPATAPTPPPSELSGVLDEELRALPQTYRDPIVLCHLQGMTVEEAAKALAVSEGQLRGRLFRGREKLRERLTKRGVVLSVSALVVSLTAGTARAVPAALRTAAVVVVSGPVSASVLTLTHEVLSAMSRMNSHLLVASVVLVAGLIATGAVVKTASADQPDRADAKPAPSPLPQVQNAPAPRDDDEKKTEDKIDRREGTLKSIDAAGNKLVFVSDEDDAKIDLTADIDAKTQITVGRRAAKLGELKEGMKAEVCFKGNEKVAFKVAAGWPRLNAFVTSVDAARSTIVIKSEADKDFNFDITLPVAADVDVTLDGLPAGLADIGTEQLKLEFAADKKTVVGIDAPAKAGDLSADVKAADAKGVTLVVQVAGHWDERQVELAFAPAADLKVRLSGKDAKADDLKADMPVLVRFAADRKTVTHIWAGPVRVKEKEDDDK